MENQERMEVAVILCISWVAVTDFPKAGLEFVAKDGESIDERSADGRFEADNLI